ncbi:MAG: hypothetical protein RLZZ528_1972 [Pseudomonadota bacterium]
MTRHSSDDRILPGVALMIAFCAIAPLIDVFSKLAAEQGQPVGQISLARFAVQALVMAPLLPILGHSFRLSARDTGLTFVRAAFLLLSTYAFISAIAVMPIADALAIVFIEPFILLLLGRFLFGEKVGPRRIGACVLGFVGSLLVIQPSLAIFGLVALWPLGTAVFFALYMIVTRIQSKAMHPVPMQFHTAWAGVALCLPVLVAFEGSGIPDLDSTWPDGLGWAWLVGVGVAAALSHMAITYALMFAPSSTLAPLHYLELVMAVALGYLIFGDFPTPLTWAGIAIITASGLYVIHRERIAAARARLTAGAALTEPR